MEKYAISRQYPRLVPIPNRGGTSTHGQRQSGTDTNQSGTDTNQSGTSTHSQKRVGTGTNQSGTGTDASSSPAFCSLVLLSPNSYSGCIGTLIND